VTRAVVCALLVLASWASPAAAQVYRWTDDEGVVHLTTDAARIPPKYRDIADKLEASPRDAVEPPAAAPTVRAAPGSAILTDAHVNGVPLTFLVDTGASGTGISPAILARDGIDSTGGRPIGLVGVGGSVRAVEVDIPRLDLAGAQIGPLAVVVLEIPGLTADGLLGRDVLEHFVLTVDPVRGRATLTR
jgi:predicted aspartyl protease